MITTEAEDNRFLVTGLYPHGVYYYRLLAINGDGVPTIGLGRKYVVPNQSPPTPEIFSPVRYGSTNVKFIFNQLDSDVDGDKLSYQVYLDKGDGFVIVPWDEQQACYSVTLSPEDHGKTYWWYVKVDDGHGGIAESEKVAFQLDAVAPVLKLIKPDTVYTTKKVNLRS